MCGRFLRHLLAEESWHSTPVGRLLLPVLVAFRFLLLVASGPGVFGDEQSEFVCNTQQPGCKTACYDAFHPLSPLRFWAFQVFLMAVPSALYLGFTLYHVIWHWEESGLKEKGEEESLIPDGDSNRGTSWTGSRRLLGAYVAHLVVRLVLEGVALGSQYYLYGFNVPISVSCHRDPCPFSITCNVSRPSEKTIFLKTMFGITAICLSFTLLELVFVLLWKWRRTQKNKFSCNNFLIQASPKRHKEPTGDFPALETKE